MGLVVACAALLAACEGVRIPSQPPSVFLVVWDTTRADHLGIYGYERDTTPILGAIAEGGVVFDQAHVVATWTIPSVASLFTGLFQHNHKVDWGAGKHRTLALGEGVNTLAEVLRDAGYATALYSAQGIYMRRGGFLQGFDESDHTRRNLAGRVLDFVDRNPDRPSFVVAYWKNPHAIYQPNRRFDLWSDPNLPPYTLKAGRSNDPVRIGSVDVRRGKTRLLPEHLSQMQAKYDGEIRQNDEELGTLWRGLEERGLADRSLFVFTSDHGEAFGDHANQLVGHGLPYETNQRVPLVLRLPGALPPGRVRDLVRSIDVYPTILELAGVQLAHPINGASLLPLIGRRLPAFMETDRIDRSYVGTTHHPGQKSYFRTARHKLIRDDQSGDLEVYDVARDPGERDNLAESRPELTERIVARIPEFIAETAIEVEGVGTVPVTPEDVEQLKALGYGE